MEIRDDFILSLNSERLRIKNHPGFVFLFGGKPHEKNIEDLDGQRIDKGLIATSMRGLVDDYLKAKHRNISPLIFMPELFEDWLNHSTYNDLFDFEFDLAELASLIVIIVESNGAIAELGAFTSNLETKDKLLVYSNEQFISNTSFIELGLYKNLDPDSAGRVNFYSWNFKIPFCENKPPILHTNIENSRDKAELIAESISDSYSDFHKDSPIFDSKKIGHWMLLIADLIQRMHALTISEIREYVQIIGKDFSEKRMKQLLYILEKLDLIQKSRSGRSTYYIPGVSSNKGYISYSYTQDIITAKELQEQLIVEYRANDRHRIHAMGI